MKSDLIYKIYSELKNNHQKYLKKYGVSLPRLKDNEKIHQQVFSWRRS